LQQQARTACSKAVQARLVYRQLLPQMSRGKAGRQGYGAGKLLTQARSTI